MPLVRACSPPITFVDGDCLLTQIRRALFDAFLNFVDGILCSRLGVGELAGLHFVRGLVLVEDALQGRVIVGFRVALQILESIFEAEQQNSTTLKGSPYSSHRTKVREPCHVTASLGERRVESIADS